MESRYQDNKTLINRQSVRADDLYARSLIGDGEERVGNTMRTDLELKRAALHPAASLSDQTVRQVRAAAMGVSIYDYEKTLREIGVEY